MKSFLEEYGFAILAAIVVILLIAMATPVGSTIKEQVSGLVNSMSKSTLHKLQSSDNEISVILTTTPSLTIASKSNTDKFKYIIHYVENGEERQTSSKEYRNTEFILDCKPDKHSNLYAEVIDVGTDKHYYSNVIKVSNNELSSININPNTIIQLDGRPYVVLQNKGNNQHLVMDIDGIGSKSFDTDSNIYENSDIDGYLDKQYYNLLSYKDAIVEQSIQQNFFKSVWENENYKWIDPLKPIDGCSGPCININGKWESWDKKEAEKGKPGALIVENVGSTNNEGQKTNLIKRKVFLPSVDEVSQVVNVNDQWEMEYFLKGKNDTSLSMWFRDADYYNNSNMAYGCLSLRSLSFNPVYYEHLIIRPAFVIDLSKVDFINTNVQYVK